MNTSKNKETVCRFVRAINSQDWAALDELVASDFRRHSAAAPGVQNREGLKDFLRGEFVTFPDATETVLDVICEGNRVAVRHGFSGTQKGPLGVYPASLRRLEATYLAIYRIEHGRIAEAWVEWDNLAGLRQLGHVRDPSQV